MAQTSSINFLIISPPRCGSTWLTNYLMSLSSDIIVLHDLSNNLDMKHWEQQAVRIRTELNNPNLIIGICDTGIGIMPKEIQKLFPNIPKLILIRDMEEVEESLNKIGLELLDSPQDWRYSLNELSTNIRSLALHYNHMFNIDYMLLILGHLKIDTKQKIELFEFRFNEFKKINCQPHFPLTSTSDSVAKVIQRT